MSVSRRIQTNAGWSLISLAAVAVFGFASMYFNARALGVEGLGILAGLLALSMMLEALAGMQSWQAVLALSDGRESRILGAALLINFAATVLGVAIGLGALSLLDFGGGWAATLLIGSQFFRVSDPLTGILRKHDHFGFLAFVRSSTAAVTFLMAVTFWYLAAPISAYLVSFALIYLANNAILFAKTMQICWPTRPADGEIWEVFAFSLPTGLSGAIGSIRQRGIIVLLGLVSGSGAVGMYSVADRIASLLQMAYRAVFEAVFREMPTLSRPFRLVGGIALAATVFSCVVLAATYWLGLPLITFVAGSEFAPAAPTLILLVAAVCISLITLGIRAWTIVKIGPRAMLGCNVFALLGLACAPYLIGTFGVAGAGVTQIVFEALWVFALLVVLMRNRHLIAVKSDQVERPDVNPT